VYPAFKNTQIACRVPDTGLATLAARANVLSMQPRSAAAFADSLGTDREGFCFDPTPERAEVAKPCE
jgi:hypothetical protein